MKGVIIDTFFCLGVFGNFNIMTREETIKKYDELLSKCPDIDRKGKSMPYTSANGHMFSQVNKAGELGIRFSKVVQQLYLESMKPRSSNRMVLR